VDYSLFMMVMMVLTSERVEKCPGATLAAFSPPIFNGTTSVSVFHVSLPPLDVGGIYIKEFLGQAEHLETKIDDVGGLRWHIS
jgi:hypothetical protein